jgi:acetyltransferase-like isoleucine patch superfamily enzyme
MQVGWRLTDNGTVKIHPLTLEQIMTSFPDADIAPSTIIYPGVSLGKNAVIEEFCIIGRPINHEPKLITVLGDDCMIRSHTVIYAGNLIGNHFQTGHKVNIRESNRIGNKVSIGTLSVVEHHIEIQDGVRIHSQAFIPEYTILEQDAWIGPQVVLTNARYPLSPNAKAELAGPVIRRKAKIGANSTILPGIEIGENSLVGAGSVVTKPVSPNQVVAGNPASFIKPVSELPY